MKNKTVCINLFCKQKSLLKTTIKNRQGKYEENIEFTTDPSMIKQADFILICVPTPVTKSKEPDLRYIKSAAEIVGRYLKRGAIVVLESTVYPGVTEEVVAPILEKESRLKCGVDFKISYSPERINPGDDAHALDKITKIVAGMDEEATEDLAELYGLITTVYKAKESGYHPQVILAGRAINDYMPRHIAEMAIKGLNETFLQAKTFTKYMCFFGKAFFSKERFVIKSSKVLIMALTYKENVPDTRESPVKEMVEELKEFGVEVYGDDSLLSKEGIESFDVKTLDFSFSTCFLFSKKKKCKVDCIIMEVVYDAFKEITLDALKGMMNDKSVLIDVRSIFTGEAAEKTVSSYRSL